MQIWGSSGKCSACIYLDVGLTSHIGHRISGRKALWSPHTKIILGGCLSNIPMIRGSYMNLLSMQVLALIVTIFGFVVSLPFQIFIREKPNVHLKKLEWYKWLKNPQFYLVIMKTMYF